MFQVCKASFFVVVVVVVVVVNSPFYALGIFKIL